MSARHELLLQPQGDEMRFGYNLIPVKKTIEFEGNGTVTGYHALGHVDKSDFAYSVGYSFDRVCPTSGIVHGWWQPEQDDDYAVDDRRPMVNCDEGDTGAFAVTYYEGSDL